MSLLLSDTLISNNGFLLEFRAIIMTRQQALLTLGLNMSAREADIRTAWRKKAKFFHPDSPYADERGFFWPRAYQTLIPPVPKAFRVQARSRSF